MLEELLVTELETVRMYWNKLKEICELDADCQFMIETSIDAIRLELGLNFMEAEDE